MLRDKKDVMMAITCMIVVNVEVPKIKIECHEVEFLVLNHVRADLPTLCLKKKYSCLQRASNQGSLV